MKTCSNCGETKPIEEFQRLARNKDGRTNVCKLCKRAYDNAHYQSHPQRRLDIRASDARRCAINQTWIKEYLESHPCVDCGETDIVVLQFDHQGDKVMAISAMIRTCSLSRIKAEVVKCLVRCANCHARKTATDFSWWRLPALIA